jgi:hypothetical protein
MHEDLLGYLIGALEPHEMRRVEQWLREDPAAREELTRIESKLRPLEETSEPIESPPPDLVARTMAALPPLPGSAATHSQGGDAEGDTVDLVAMRPAQDAPRGSGVTWIDWASGAVAAAVLLGLLIPALAEGRFEARRTACQDQLRQLGVALTQFVSRNNQGRLPAVADQGPEAFAGVYWLRLHEAGLVDDPSVRWCPSVDPPSDGELMLVDSSPTVTTGQLHRVSANRLRDIQRLVGGHYAYTLGVIDEDKLRSPRYESRSAFAVMSDAPMIGMSGGAVRPESIGHSGRGINVLYEDGSVRFIELQALQSIPDHPLLNHRGRMEAGINIDDAALAPSWHPPFVHVRQR